MLSKEIKDLIMRVATLYSQDKLTQSIINQGKEDLKQAVLLLKSQEQPSEPTEERTTPITLEELEVLIPKEPEYPDLQLRDDYDLEVTLKDSLLSLEVEEGTIVKTHGYYAVNDGGQAVYEIMSYDNWWNQLPIELKLIHVCTNGLGNNFLYKNPGDNFGNHILKNGMIARLLPNLDGYVRVEQWGVFEGRKDNNRALMAVCAYNHQNAKILFGKNKRYELWYTPESPHWKNASGISTTGYNGTLFPRGVSEDSFGKMGNEYAICLHSRCTTKPVIGDAKNLELCGNNCEFYIPNEQFTIGGADFALIEMGGRIDGLKIHGFHLNGNHFGQLWQGKQGASYARTCNHGISYFSSGINGNNGGVSPNGKMLDPNGVELPFTVNELKNYNGDQSVTCFNNVEIYGNHFESLGTSQNVSDCGGDAILIINPMQSDNVNIHNNRVTNWGRWCFAVDLGGNGERFYNYTIKQNICIQDDRNTFAIPFTNPRKPTTKFRGLGFIDFEARKCFTNLDVSENYVYGANGWAFNGNGKVSENIKIGRNHIERPSYDWRSIYPYAFTFYSVYAKDLTIKHNIINGGSVGFGNLFYNTVIENNNFIGTGTIGINNPFKNVLIKNNIGEGTRNQLFSLNVGTLEWVNNENSEFYVPEEERVTTVIFENNGEGGVCGNIINKDNDPYKKNISLIFKNNTFRKFNVNCFGIKDYQFTPDQLFKGDMAWSARGCKISNAVISRCVDNPVPGGLYYKEGDLVTSTLSNVARLYSPYYFEDAFPQLKNDNGSIKKDMNMYCTVEGVFPLNGEFLMCDDDSYFAAGSNKSVGNFMYTLDNLYYVTVAGNLGDVEPTHTEGIAINGTCELLWVAPIARYEMR